MTVIVGKLLDRVHEGHATYSHKSRTGATIGGGTISSVYPTQPGTIPVEYGYHGGSVIGSIAYLELDHAGSLHFVAEVSDHPSVDLDWFGQASIDFNARDRDGHGIHGEEALIRAVAMVEETAAHGIRGKVRTYGGTVAQPTIPIGISSHDHTMLKRAKANPVGRDARMRVHQPEDHPAFRLDPMTPGRGLPMPDRRRSSRRGRTPVRPPVSRPRRNEPGYTAADGTFYPSRRRDGIATIPRGGSDDAA